MMQNGGEKFKRLTCFNCFACAIKTGWSFYGPPCGVLSHEKSWRFTPQNRLGLQLGIPFCQLQ